MLHVVAGIIESKGKILLCQRHRSSKRFPLKWEFPGGKVEQCETPEQAMIRELNEELDIKCNKISLMTDYDFAYESERTFHLHFYKIENYSGEIKNLQFEKILWVEPGDISEFDLLDGDRPFLERWDLSV